MMRRVCLVAGLKSFLLISYLSCVNCAFAIENSHFKILPLGTYGGELDDNLSSYLIAPAGSQDWVALDAGTLCHGIKILSQREFEKLGGEKQLTRESFFLNKVKGYLISHAHLDHINGLVLCSTIDKNKPILALSSTIDYLKKDIFNWEIWPNFADEGKVPQLRKYHYQHLKLGEIQSIPNTSMSVQPFVLSHGVGYISTAFLIGAQGYYVIYFGDTGADAVEKSSHLQDVCCFQRRFQNVSS